MGPGSHMILMLLWARKEAAKHMVRVHADGTEQCFVSGTVSLDVLDGGTLCVSYGL